MIDRLVYRVPNEYALFATSPRMLFIVKHSGPFQGIGNRLPPLFSSLTRLVLFALPALIISRMPGFEIREVWYLSVGTILVHVCVNLFLLRHELRNRLRFDEPEDFIPASATAS